MAYYSNNNDGGCLTLIICAILTYLFMFGFNSYTAETWNNGVCDNCEVKYELRCASRSLKYYSCPECGQEISRYGFRQNLYK